MKKVIGKCPICGTEFIEGDGKIEYIHETGYCDCTCGSCGWEGSETDLDMENEDEDEELKNMTHIIIRCEYSNGLPVFIGGDLAPNYACAIVQFSEQVNRYIGNYAPEEIDKDTPTYFRASSQTSGVEIQILPECYMIDVIKNSLENPDRVTGYVYTDENGEFENTNHPVIIFNEQRGDVCRVPNDGDILHYIVKRYDMDDDCLPIKTRFVYDLFWSSERDKQMYVSDSIENVNVNKFVTVFYNAEKRLREQKQL